MNTWDGAGINGGGDTGEYGEDLQSGGIEADGVSQRSEDQSVDG